MLSIPQIDTNIRSGDIKRLNSIFGKLGWKMHLGDDNGFKYEEVFDSFCDFLSCLGSDEIDLVLNLTEDFLHCPYTIYPTLMKEALLQIPEDITNNCEKIFLIPLINPKDIGQTKSSTSILYSFLHTVIPRIPNLNNKNPKSFDSPNLLLEKYPNRKNSLVLLLDDYIGSGDTAIEALAYYNDKIRCGTDIPIVISLVAQSEGMLKIKNYGFTNYTARKRGKCISDSKKITDKCKAIKVIRKIEKRMGVSRDFRLGYKKSQALVSMMRTPNNTLPIYWWKKKPNGEEWNGIFRRG